MMFSLISWFIISVLIGTVTLSAIWSREITRWRTAALLGYLGGFLVSGGALLASQGWSSPCTLLLPGKYNVIGYLPVPDENIYIFLETKYGPKTCHIPWDPAKADELKKQQEGDGTEITISWGSPGGGSGLPGTDESLEIVGRPPPEGHENKPAEEQPPMFSIGE